MMRTWMFIKQVKLYRQHKHRNEAINQSGIVSVYIHFGLSLQKLSWLTKNRVKINSSTKIKWISKDRWSEHEEREGKREEGNVTLFFNQSGRQLVFLMQGTISTQFSFPLKISLHHQMRKWFNQNFKIKTKMIWKKL